jgi:DNA-binding LytR/AlgR family response regulator
MWKIYREGATRQVMASMTLMSLEEQLPAEQFMRVHRSFHCKPGHDQCDRAKCYTD